MPYTNKAVASVFIVTLTLFALSGFGVVGNSWVLLLALAALVAPTLILRSWSMGEARLVLARPHAIAVATRHRPGRPKLEPSGIDLYQWENDGGAGVWKHER
jgi:hypothetical protein